MPPESLAVPPHVIAAHAWVIETYPDLAQRRMHTAIDGDASHYRIEISEPPATPLAAATVRVPILLVEAHFTAAGALEALAAQGPAVATPRLEALRARLATRSRWTDEEIDAEVRARGGTFGPSARAAVLERAQRLAETRKEAAPIVGTAFERTARHGPVWVVDVQGDTRIYRAVFEPFTGQLIAVTPR